MFHLDQIVSSESFQFWSVMVKNTILKKSIHMDVNRNTPCGFAIAIIHPHSDWWKKYFCGFDCMNEICKIIKENGEIKNLKQKKYESINQENHIKIKKFVTIVIEN